LAEGVEKRAQVQSLRDLGCDLVQGYLYSPPLDESSFINYLQEFEENEELSSRSTI
jgi:EAL domain-containing protein (putative c-di-GMP-specific phosphodiesterase class I)